MVPDYYAMLGVDPSADRASIEAALARCQPQWSAGTRNPKSKHTYQSYLDQIPAIRQALLSGPEARARYDQLIAASRQAERNRKLDELHRLVRLRAAKGGLTVSDRELLRQETARLGLLPEDLDRLIEPIPPRPESPADVDPPDEPRDVLDATVRRQIRVALEHLRKRDLYEVLDLQRDAPIDEILAAAQAKRREWMHKTQVTAEKTAWLEAVSYAQSHLGTPAARARYDQTLELEAEEAFQSAVDFALTGLSRLDPATREVLRDEAVRLGIAPDRADVLIRRHARRLGVALEGGGAPPAPRAGRLLRCRACGGISTLPNSAQKGACKHCGASLKWECPVCPRDHWVDQPRCACGFPLENLDLLRRHLDAAQEALKAREYDEALQHLGRVRLLAPRHGGAKRGIEKIKERLAEIERARAAWEIALASGQLLVGRKVIIAWMNLANPGDPALKAAQAELSLRLTRATALATQAQECVASDPARARSLFRQSLALASDLPAALEGLALCPPDPPRDLKASVVEGRIRLRWDAPTPDGLGAVSYRVLRKPGAVPTHSGDGVVVAEVSATECEDTGAAPGEVVGYAVFSRRGPAESRGGSGFGPFLVLGEVSHVETEVRSDEVLLSWKLPAGAIGAQVVRKVGSPPVGPGDGERIEAMREQALDRSVREGTVYYYAIHALYPGSNGRAVTGRGVIVTVLPHAPNPPVGAPTLRREPDGRLRVGWTAPERGQVRIFKSAQPLNLSPGTRLGPNQLEGLRGEFLATVAVDHTFDGEPPEIGVRHYTPMTSWAGSLTVGVPVVYSCIPDPTDLRALRVGGTDRVNLRWRWAPLASETLILAVEGRDPTGPDDPAARRFTVTEDEYAQRGYFAVELPAGGRPWHVAVMSVAQVDQTRIISQGLEPSARLSLAPPAGEITVGYHLRPPRFPGRPWSVTFRTEPPGQLIPPTVLVVHPRTVPLSVEDGEIADQFPASRDGATFRIRPRLNLARHRARVFADPRADPDNLPPIRLRHPEAGATRV